MTDPLKLLEEIQQLLDELQAAGQEWHLEIWGVSDYASVYDEGWATDVGSEYEDHTNLLTIRNRLLELKEGLK